MSVGLVGAMAKEDVLLPAYREHGGMLLRGVTLLELLLCWGGDERGSAFAGPWAIAGDANLRASAGASP